MSMNVTSFGFKVDHPRCELVENFLYIFILDTWRINQYTEINTTAFGVDVGDPGASSSSQESASPHLGSRLITLNVS